MELQEIEERLESIRIESRKLNKAKKELLNEEKYVYVTLWCEVVKRKLLRKMPNSNYVKTVDDKGNVFAYSKTDVFETSEGAFESLINKINNDIYSHKQGIKFCESRIKQIEENKNKFYEKEIKKD